MTVATTTDASMSAPLGLELPTVEVRLMSNAKALRLARVVAGCALAAMFLAHLGMLTFVDPDLWHEMALARELIAAGTMPLVDEYAYTSTVQPVVHHEWGTGVVLYAVSMLGGSTSLMTLKYALSFGTAILCCAAARRRGASWEVLFSVAPLTILSGIIGFTTVRAQLFTLFFVALLMYDLACADGATDSTSTTRSSSQVSRSSWLRWLKWLPLYVAWLNLHAGFVVGVGILALYGCERLCRRQPVGLLLAVGFALVGLVAINPYGIEYYPYLYRALTMPRPLVTEWQPLWTAEPTMFRLYLASVLLVLYAVPKLGVRQMQGLLILAVCALLAAKHTRHLSIYLVVWLSLTPAYLERTRLGSSLRMAWAKRCRWIAVAGALIFGLSGTQAALSRPWELDVPTSEADARLGRPVYPVGAVAYLREHRVRGNLFTPFVPGGYCLYQLHPAMKVSLDGRYEVAYAPGVLEENVAFYAAKSGWRETLDKYPTDFVLVPRTAAITEPLTKLSEWQPIYTDAMFIVFARTGSKLPRVERADAPTTTAFP